MRELFLTVPQEDDGRRAGDFLRKRGFSRRILTELKQDVGALTRDGEHLRTIDPVRTGDTLRLLLREGEAPLANPALMVPIAYEDEDVLVFDKPAGMAVHPTLGHHGDTLANAFGALCAARNAPAAFRPINRLDKDTSGLCVTAKNTLAAVSLQRSLQKVYVAVLCGELPDAEGVIDLPIGREDGSIIRRQVREDGKRAVTHFSVLARGGGLTLVRIRLETGRTHQIRVHFSHRGYPLAGDSLYGGDTSLLSAHALHCAELSFPQPVTGSPVTVHSPLRADMRLLLDSAGLAWDNGKNAASERNSL